MPKFNKEVNVDTYVDVDIDISVDEILEELTQSEKRELLARLKNENYFRYDEREFYLSSFFEGVTDSEILNSQEILGKLIYFLKYHDSSLLEWVKEELNSL